MPSAVVAAPRRARRARYLIPLGTPGRRELLAALAVLGVLGGLLFAPVTLGLAGRPGRLRAGLGTRDRPGRRPDRLPRRSASGDCAAHRRDHRPGPARPP